MTMPINNNTLPPSIIFLFPQKDYNFPVINDVKKLAILSILKIIPISKEDKPLY